MAGDGCWGRHRYLGSAHHLHLVKVVLNVQDFLGQQSQAIQQHPGLMNHCQVDQPGGTGKVWGQGSGQTEWAGGLGLEEHISV